VNKVWILLSFFDDLTRFFSPMDKCVSRCHNNKKAFFSDFSPVKFPIAFRSEEIYFKIPIPVEWIKDWSNIVVAGGLLHNAIVGDYPSFRKSDIDIFLIHPDPTEPWLRDKVQSIIQWFEDWCKFENSRVVYKYAVGGKDTVDVINMAMLKSHCGASCLKRGCVRKVQIIVSSIAPDLCTLLERFDIGACQFAFDGSRIYATPAARHYLENGRIYYTSKSKHISPHRFAKYNREYTRMVNVDDLKAPQFTHQFKDCTSFEEFSTTSLDYPTEADGKKKFILSDIRLAECNLLPKKRQFETNVYFSMNCAPLLDYNPSSVPRPSELYSELTDPKCTKRKFIVNIEKENESSVLPMHDPVRTWLLPSTHSAGFSDGHLSPSIGKLMGQSCTSPDYPHCIIFCDPSNHCIRVVHLLLGVVTTLSGTPSVSGNQRGPYFVAKFDHPNGICWSSDNHCFLVADTKNDRVLAMDSFGHVIDSKCLMFGHSWAFPLYFNTGTSDGMTQSNSKYGQTTHHFKILDTNNDEEDICNYFSCHLVSPYVRQRTEFREKMCVEHSFTNDVLQFPTQCSPNSNRMNTNVDRMMLVSDGVIVQETKYRNKLLPSLSETLSAWYASRFAGAHGLVTRQIYTHDFLNFEKLLFNAHPISQVYETDFVFKCMDGIVKCNKMLILPKWKYFERMIDFGGVEAQNSCADFSTLLHTSTMEYILHTLLLYDPNLKQLYDIDGEMPLFLREDKELIDEEISVHSEMLGLNESWPFRNAPHPLLDFESIERTEVSSMTKINT
jgi:hypothetical protein